jgi:hypothetical protein
VGGAFENRWMIPTGFMGLMDEASSLCRICGDALHAELGDPRCRIAPLLRQRAAPGTGLA